MTTSQNLYEINVLIRNKTIPKYKTPSLRQHGILGDPDAKTYVEGRSGSEFELELKNNSAKEVLMIVSVDGLSVTDGKEASEKSNGYLVSANSTIKIPGWTLNDKSVAKFVFADKKDSYASNHPEHVSEKNVGVIGVLVFSKKEKAVLPEIKYVPVPYPVYPSWPYSGWNYQPFNGNPYQINATYSSSSLVGGFTNTSVRGGHIPGTESLSFNSSSACSDNTPTTISCMAMNSIVPQEQESFALGTGFGQETEFKTQSVAFERDQIVATLLIYYDNRKNLEKKGIIIVSKKSKELHEPNAFPKASPEITGCKPPYDWKKHIIRKKHINK